MNTVLSDVEKIWEAELEDLRNATKSIYYEQYVHECVKEGQIGREFIDVLVKKAEEGVKVRCIFDAIGSLELFDDSDCRERLARAGAMVFFYKTPSKWSLFWRPLRVVLRDHRKLLLIDDRVLWIGGAVVKENMRDANDIMVRYDSPQIVAGMRDEFSLQFKRLNDADPLIAPLRRFTKDSVVVGNAPGVGNRFCYERICHAIMLAEKEVTIVTPYFAPPYKLRKILLSVMSRGVRVTLLISKQTDNRLADIGREPYIHGLVKNGMILHYQHKLNHGKAVVVDGRWATFGSTNIDILSLIFNHELNIETEDEYTIHALEQAIEGWKKNSTCISFSETEYRHYPFYKKWFAQIIKYGV